MAKDYLVISEYDKDGFDAHTKFKIVPKCGSAEEALRISGWQPMFEEETVFAYELAEGGMIGVFTT